MSNISQSPIRRFFASRLFLFISLPLAVLVAFGYARSFYQGYKINQEIKALQAEVATLERKKIESLDILKYVESNEFVERQARTELNLKRPGERVLVATNRPAETVTETSEAEAGQRLNNPLKWWYYFAHTESR